MANDFQKTLNNSYIFEGKGLHTGKVVKMTIGPAPTDTGIVFIREDLGENVRIGANVDYVTHTQRGTTLEAGDGSVSTIEHLLSTFVGLGIDNAYVSLTSQEVPIMDGSAKPFVEAICKDGVAIQDKPRFVYEIKERLHIKDDNTGAELTVLPADDYSIDLTIDFNSKVLGIQKAEYLSKETDYVTEIAPCRTFVFLHEIAFLYKNGLIKGGDLDNAIVIVEHEMGQDELDDLASVLNMESLKSASQGYLEHIKLRFPNECARHKLLDVMGDFALIGFPIKGKVIAYKSGHGINTRMARLIRETALKQK